MRQNLIPSQQRTNGTTKKKNVACCKGTVTRGRPSHTQLLCMRKW